LLPFKIGLMNGQEARGSGLQKTGLRQQRPSSLCRSSRDPRYIARKAQTYLTSARIGDRVRIPTQSGRGFRFDVGHRSDLIPATIPK
jgi:hypothetical protein